MATAVDCQRFFNCSIFTVNINGTKITVTVTASASVIDEWLNTTLIRGADDYRRHKLSFGLGMDRDVNTMHLCVGDRCLIVQISQADWIPPSLRNLFYDYACKFGGFWNGWHVDRMARSKHRLVIYRNPLDLRFLEDGLENLSVEKMIYECLGFEVELKEEIRKSSWSGKDLSNDQVLYACVEAYAAFAIGVKLEMWLLCF
jgi:hypothetical protein